MKKVEILAVVAIIIGMGVSLWISLPLFKKKPVEEVTPVITESAVEAPAVITPEEEALIVRAMKVERKNFEDVLPVLGTIKGFLEIELKFETSGVIKSLEVKEADRLKKGDLVAMLEDTDAQLKLQYSRKKLESARAQSLSAGKKKEISEGLYKAGAIIKQKLDETTLEAEAVKSQEGMAEAEIKLAEAELKKTILFAPKEGIVGSKDIEVGEFVTPQNKIISLYDLGKVYVELGVVEKDIEKVKIGQRAEVQLDSYPNETFSGNIDNILPIIEGRSRTLTTKVTLDNAKGLLLPGMFSRAKIYLTEIRNAIFVPRASIIPLTPEENIIPIVDPTPHSREDIEKGVKAGVVQFRKVTLGYASTDYVHIVEGLDSGDLIIIEARGEIKEGVKVKVVGLEELIL